VDKTDASGTTPPAVEAAHRTLREQGRGVMSEVLGAPYLARRDDSTNDFNAPLRRLSEEFAYASIWTRSTLSRRERSLITLGMLCALNRPHELRIHLTGAINNGCTAGEIRELITHSVAYCGFPAAIDALRIAEEFLHEKGMLTT
jgi:4-carboxymuconolactone decarboxylase